MHQLETRLKTMKIKNLFGVLDTILIFNNLYIYIYVPLDYYSHRFPKIPTKFLLRAYREERILFMKAAQNQVRMDRRAS